MVSSDRVAREKPTEETDLLLRSTNNIGDTVMPEEGKADAPNTNGSYKDKLLNLFWG